MKTNECRNGTLQTYQTRWEWHHNTFTPSLHLFVHDGNIACYDLCSRHDWTKRARQKGWIVAINAARTQTECWGKRGMSSDRENCKWLNSMCFLVCHRVLSLQIGLWDSEPEGGLTQAIKLAERQRISKLHTTTSVIICDWLIVYIKRRPGSRFHSWENSYSNPSVLNMIDTFTRHSRRQHTCSYISNTRLLHNKLICFNWVYNAFSFVLPGPRD